MPLQRFALPTLIVVYVVLATAYSVTVPLGEAPDEVSHFAYVQYLLTEHRLPLPQGAVAGEAHQPPAHYLLGALATFWIPQTEYTPVANPDFAFEQAQTPNLLLHTRREAFPYRGAALAWHILRLLSVLLGAITVWVTWHMAQELLPNETFIPLGAAAFVAFLPSFTFLSAVVNNDNLIIALSSVCVLIAVRMTRRALTVRELLLLGILLGLATLTKLSGLVVWLFAATMLAYRFWIDRDWRRLLGHAILVFGIAILTIAPWMIYNLIIHGDPLGWSLVMSTTPVRETPLTLDELARTMGGGLWTSFWGRFGGAIHLRMADAVYIVFGVISLLVIVGWIKYCRARNQNSDAHTALMLFAVFWLLMLAAFARWTLAVLGTDQARQLFPGLPLFAIVFTFGLGALLPRRKNLVLSFASAGLIALDVAVLVSLTMTFVGSSQNLATLPRLGGASTPIDFGQTIRIVDYRIPSQVAPGNDAVIEIEWQALANLHQDYWLLLQLGDPKTPLAQKEGTPAAGHPTTDWWNKNERYASSHRLTIPPDAPPGTYSLRIGLHPYGTWDWLPIFEQDMATLGKITIPGP